MASWRIASRWSCLVVLALAACSESTGPADGHTIDADGGTVSAFGDSVKLTFPPGSVSSAVIVTIDRVAAPPGASALVAGSAVELGPDGTTFAQPVQLELSYDPAGIPAGATEADLRIHVFDSGEWTELPTGSTLNAAARRISGSIAHFSTYAVMAASASNVALSDTASGPITALVGRELVGMAYDAAGVPLVGAPLTLTTLDPAIGAVDNGLVVRGVAPGAARMVLSSGAVADTLAIDVTFGWREIRLSLGGNAPWHGCGIGQDDAVYCWGQNNVGQVGVGGTAVLAPTLVPNVPAAGAQARLVVGSQASCFWSGTEWTCWGAGHLIGTGSAGTIPPTTITSLPPDGLTLGYAGSCAAPAGGTAECWGTNFGSAGAVNWTPQPVPQPGGAWKLIRPGFNVTCGLTVADRAYCWGLGVFGALGTGQTVTSSDVPLAVSTATPFADLSVGANVACGLTTQGGVYCWGRNAGGLLGDPAAVPTSSSPLQVPLPSGRALAVRSDATSFGLGTAHACGLTSTSPQTILCWGQGQASGAIGDGLMTDAYAPKPVSSTVAFQSLAVGAVNNCAITPYGAAYCWGLQVAGSLGIASVANGSTQAVPALISTP